MKIEIYNKLLIPLILVCSFAILPVAFAQNSFDEGSTRNLIESDRLIYFSTDALNSNKKLNIGDLDNLQSFVGKIFNVLFSIAGTIAVVLLVVVGTQRIYANLNDSVENKINTKKKLLDIIIGIIILLMSWLILNLVDSRLLKPDIFVGLEKLKIGTKFSSEIKIDEVEYNQLCRKFNPAALGVNPKVCGCQENYNCILFEASNTRRDALTKPLEFKILLLDTNGRLLKEIENSSTNNSIVINRIEGNLVNGKYTLEITDPDLKNIAKQAIIIPGTHDQNLRVQGVPTYIEFVKPKIVPDTYVYNIF